MSDERLHRARIALEGLSVGDAFGSFFEFNAAMLRLIEGRLLPPTPWSYTDDTSMALSVYDTLRRYGGIDQHALAASYVAHFDPMRGYGVSVRQMLARMKNGAHWQDVAQEIYWGEGSFGSDAAMHIAPVGAYFADDIAQAVEQAKLAAGVTHTHPEGIAGAVAVAAAAAYAWQSQGEPLTRQTLIERVLPHVPASAVREGIQRACDLPQGTTAPAAAETLGNGSRASTQDTVPFVLWCAGEFSDDYEEAIWQAARALGDVDTICAMVGGIVVLRTGSERIPADWLNHREPLPGWAFSG
ncbi:MAG TPA: ADP-ribosylglycohydrolase family protein [Spirillospora sp.]|nr:ADP-ribosylglycohydrolase family protein [Spirillospora sp.]